MQLHPFIPFAGTLQCRSWLMSGWQASELDFDVDPEKTPKMTINKNV